MYNFIDVTEASEGTALPSEALMLNGEYIEDLIAGYRTLSVSGREALAPELDYYETGVRDGSTLRSRRYPARTITVQYQLIAESNEAFREAYNQLGKILNVENAELIFADEQDKFFTGTPCGLPAPEPGRNSVIGEIEFFCANPFKYSVVEYEAEPDLDEKSILVNYNGTYKSYPTLEADFYNEEESSEDGETVTELTGSGDCGFVAFFNENEKIIQLGDPDEEDAEKAYAKAQTLFNHRFNKNTSWGSAAKSQWAVNSGITSSDAVVQSGKMAMAVASYTAATTPANTSGTLLKAISTAGVVTMYYTITAKTTNRTASSVKVSVSITTALKKATNYFGQGYGLTGQLYIGGSWRTITLKKTTEYWKGNSGHTVNATYTISGLASTDTALTGIKFKVTRPDGLGTSGVLAETSCNSLKISQYVTSEPETYYLAPSSFGSGTKYHGASITRTIPADAAGDVGASNFVLSYSQKMSIGSSSSATNQLGAFQALLVTGSGSDRKIVAGVNVFKGSSGKKGKLRFYVNAKTVLTMDIDLSYGNKYFNFAKSTIITKVGQTVTFNVCGIKKVFKDSSIASTLVNEVTFTITQYGTKTALAYNGLYWAKFVKNNCETWKDVPNKFSANDVVEADCSNGEILLNGVHTPSLGALGNDWEDFYLSPGLNQIGVAYSDWVEDAYSPSFKIKYREVFI